jgi:hypothetical protein
VVSITGLDFQRHNPTDILFKQVIARVGFELFVFGIACVVGGLGGWIYAVYRFTQRSGTATNG